MIICHPLKLIFVKSKKVAGTSLEIALSSRCGPDCVITPITPGDEDTRRDLGFPTAQNYGQQIWPDGTRTDHVFNNHMPSAKIAQLVPGNVWANYRKVAITRDPFDVMISRYYWETQLTERPDFEIFADRFRAFAAENEAIAPLSGPYQIDHFIRYEYMEEDLKALGLEDVWNKTSSIRAKGNLRPKTASKTALYADAPKAIEVVADQCEREIEKFGYTAPQISQNRKAPPAREDYIFTLTGGRTGSSWLAQFLAENLSINAQHEPLGIDDFGTTMPDIRLMRSFNTFGMDRHVRDFWTAKFGKMLPGYCETNHTLGKCGLIEALAEHPIGAQAKVVVLRRDLAAQAASYVVRGDFSNITLDWQWYLAPDYPNTIVSAEQFLPLGDLGKALWYTLEMTARQEYYKLQFGPQITFIEAQLEDVTMPDGAKALLDQFGYSGAVKLPQKTNATVSQNDEVKNHLEAEINKLLPRVGFDGEELARQYISAGFSLGRPRPIAPRAAAA